MDKHELDFSEYHPIIRDLTNSLGSINASPVACGLVAAVALRALGDIKGWKLEDINAGEMAAYLKAFAFGIDPARCTVVATADPDEFREKSKAIKDRNPGLTEAIIDDALRAEADSKRRRFGAIISRVDGETDALSNMTRDMLEAYDGGKPEAYELGASCALALRAYGQLRKWDTSGPTSAETLDYFKGFFYAMSDENVKVAIATSEEQAHAMAERIRKDKLDS